MATVDDAFAIAQSLTPAEQIALISRIWEAVPKSEYRPSDADLAEVKRRCAEYDAGRMEAVPWEIVRDEVRKKLRQRSESHE
ncbi:MAG TPA: addiction module protein [Lacipirellulaceae bacterium]|jgi:putative addiction module component (TIGR02574 family)